MFFASTKGGRLFTDVRFQDGDMLVFGKETAGLPRDLLSAHRQETIRIPMSRNTRLRSFNLANSANIILFEALLIDDFSTDRIIFDKIANIEERESNLINFLRNVQ